MTAFELRNITNIVAEYDLLPDDGRKSFYGKAKVLIDNYNNQFLQSYDTIVIAAFNNGLTYNTWGGWSATTGRHIKAFCGLNKAGVTRCLEYASASDIKDFIARWYKQ